VTIDEIVEREVLGEASRACDLLIDRVRGRVTTSMPQSAVELSQFAGAALEAYYDTLLRALLVGASRRASGDAERWVKDQFHLGLDRASAGLREVVADSPHRHTVAQKLQQKMFEGEVSLRRALMSRFAEGAVVGGTVGAADALEAPARSRARQRKAAS
jgi:hypothetical protein